MQTIFNLTEAAGKPLIVDEFNLQRPIAQRNEGLQLIYGLLQNTTSPVAGELGFRACKCLCQGLNLKVSPQPWSTFLHDIPTCETLIECALDIPVMILFGLDLA